MILSYLLASRKVDGDICSLCLRESIFHLPIVRKRAIADGHHEQVSDKQQCLKLVAPDIRVDGLFFGHG